jgi:hypothetical protein
VPLEDLRIGDMLGNALSFRLVSKGLAYLLKRGHFTGLLADPHFDTDINGCDSAVRACPSESQSGVTACGVEFENRRRLFLKT